MNVSKYIKDNEVLIQVHLTQRELALKRPELTIGEIHDHIYDLLFEPELAVKDKKSSHHNSSSCPFCLGSSFATDVHENDFILQKLSHFMTDLKTGKNTDELLDSYACKLTAYMNGRIAEGTNQLREESRCLARRLSEVIGGLK